MLIVWPMFRLYSCWSGRSTFFHVGLVLTAHLKYTISQVKDSYNMSNFCEILCETEERCKKSDKKRLSWYAPLERAPELHILYNQYSGFS